MTMMEGNGDKDGEKDRLHDWQKARLAQYCWQSRHDKCEEGRCTIIDWVASDRVGFVHTVYVRVLARKNTCRRATGVSSSSI